jgi:IclR family acetate operon transcriptional repressor
MAATVMNNVLTALRVLEAVGDKQPVGVSELSRLLGVPKTTVQRSLDTLRTAGWLDRNPQGTWYLSLRCAVLGRRAGHKASLRELARPAMLKLWQSTDESVRLWLPQGHSVIQVESIDSSQAVRSVGSSTFDGSLPMHASAAGKAILALLPPDEVDVLLAPPLEALTPWTMTDPDEVRAQLEQIRRLGYAETRNEVARDVGGIAAAITADGRPVAAIVLSIPMHRFSEELARRCRPLVVDAVQGLSA